MFTPWRHDKSWVENLLSVWTPLLMGVLAVTSLMLRYVRDPISCHYIYPQANEYFTEFCFKETSVLMRSDEFVEFSKQFWETHELRGRNSANMYDMWPKQRTYHQWVPFALGLAAILCLFPHVIWRMLTALLWMDNHALVQTIADSQSRSSAAGHHVTVKDSALVVRAGLKGGNWMLSVAALARKVVACAVCFLQVVLIVAWFKPPLAGEPEKVKRDLSSVNVTAPEALEDVPLPVDPFFCTVDTSQHRNIQSMTIQCLLPLNKVFIKGFIFLFYFFLFLLVLCVWDVFYWLGRLFLPHLRDVTLLRNLSVFNQSEDGKFGHDPAQFSHFLQFLGPDGRLMVALVADHCGSVAGLHFTSQLWQVFHGSSSLQERGSTPTAFNPAPLSPTSVGSSMRMQEEGYGAGNSTAHDMDIPMRDMSEAPQTDKDTAKLCPE